MNQKHHIHFIKIKNQDNKENYLMSKKYIFFFSFCFLACLFLFLNIFHTNEIYTPLMEVNDGNIKFKFTIGKLIQGIEEGDLPFHYFTHPDSKVNFKPNNPDVITTKDFIVWIGSNFKSHLSTEEKSSAKFEEEGLIIVQNKANKGFRAFQMILASYNFHFVKDKKKGLFWAYKAAEMGESGSMVILGDAFMHSDGVNFDQVEGLKWYLIASNLGDLAAQGRLLALYENTPEYIEIKNRALIEAKVWMKLHPRYFTLGCRF